MSPSGFPGCPSFSAARCVEKDQVVVAYFDETGLPTSAPSTLGLPLEGTLAQLVNKKAGTDH